MARPLTAQISLDALRHNYQLAQHWSASAQTLAVIKADAYGHGAVQAAQALQDLAPAFAVACIEEAETLYQAGIQRPILLLEGFFSAEELPLILARGYWMVIHSHWQLRDLMAFCQAQGVQNLPPIWLKVDTGMHRLGFEPQALDSVIQTLTQQLARPSLTLMTHLARADELDQPMTTQQCSTLLQHPAIAHYPKSLANSAGIMHWPTTHQDWTRPGILLYGASPLPLEHPKTQALRPVMQLTSRLISVREIAAGEAVGYGGRFIATQPTRIGVVACGYGDGYPRQAKEGTPVWIRGQKVPLAGRVSMDLLTVDLTQVPSAQAGDPVELWGQHLAVNEVAQHCDTISYTLLTGLLPRVSRDHVSVLPESTEF